MKHVLWRLRSPALAGVNLLLSAALLALPALLGARHESILALSIYLVSVQAGQGSSVQTNLHRGASGSLMAPIAVLLTALAVPVQLAFGYATITLTVLAVAGLSAGLVTGARANALLRGSSGVLGYQLFLTTRSTAWLTVTCGLTLWTADGPLWGTVAVWIPLLVTIWLSSGRSMRLRLPLGPVTVVGALAALAYRNDVNIVRAAANSLDQFERWHYTLVGYSLVQAVVGFLTLQLIYARAPHVLGALNAAKRSTKLLPAAMAGCAAAAAILVHAHVSLVVVAGLLMAAATGVSLQSAWVHISGRSVHVYIGGGIGLAACVAVVSTGGTPAVALGVELLVVAVCVAPALLFSSPESDRPRGDIVTSSSGSVNS
jgi:hypothetical protein